jgi:hypothetical protein
MAKSKTPSDNKRAGAAKKRSLCCLAHCAKSGCLPHVLKSAIPRLCGG